MANVAWARQTSDVTGKATARSAEETGSENRTTVKMTDRDWVTEAEATSLEPSSTALGEGNTLVASLHMMVNGIFCRVS